MRRPAFFMIGSSALLLCLSILTACQTGPKYGSKEPEPVGSQTPQPVGSQVSQPVGSPGSQGRFNTIEVKRFMQTDGLGLSQDFVNYFYNGLSEQLRKARIAGQVVAEGAAVPDADAANSAVLEGKFTEYKQGGFGPGIIGSEIKLYRRSDRALITTITPRVPYKSSPFNTDKNIGEVTGARTATEIAKALK